MPAARYERKVFKDLIRDAIYDAIVEGELKPGDRIIEMEWAEKFGSSQAPVREAIRDLEGRGVVESAPFKGAVVRTVNRDELKEIHAVRAGLEAVALTKVSNDLPDEALKSVKVVLDDMIKAAKAGDVQTFLDKDIEFHETIVDLADMTDLKKLWDMCNIRLWTTFSTKYSKKDLLELANNHKAIYEKMAKRDLSDVFETVSSHFTIITDALKDEMNS